MALSSVAKKLAWDAPRVKKFFAYFSEAESLLILVFAEDQWGEKAYTLPLLASLGSAPISTFCSCYTHAPSTAAWSPLLEEHSLLQEVWSVVAMNTLCKYGKLHEIQLITDYHYALCSHAVYFDSDSLLLVKTPNGSGVSNLSVGFCPSADTVGEL